MYSILHRYFFRASMGLLNTCSIQRVSYLTQAYSVAHCPAIELPNVWDARFANYDDGLLVANTTFTTQVADGVLYMQCTVVR